MAFFFFFKPGMLFVSNIFTRVEVWKKRFIRDLSELCVTVYLEKMESKQDLH